MRHFRSRALLDGDMLAIRNRKIESRNRRGDIKRHFVFFGQHSYLIRADFVRGIPIGRNAIRAGHDRTDLARLQKVANHVVRNQRQRNAALVQFPSREPCALKIRARFRYKNVQFAALFERYANHPEGRAYPACGQRARVALRHHLPFARHELRAKLPNRLVRRAFFLVNLLCFFHHALLDFRELRGFCGKFSEALLHALDRPKQVHRGGSRFSKRVANFLELRPKRVDGFRGRMQDTERRTHRRRHSNRRRSTDHHFVNRLRHLAVVRIGVSNLLGGKPPLVEHNHAALRPLDGLRYIHSLLCPRWQHPCPGIPSARHLLMA